MGEAAGLRSVRIDDNRDRDYGGCYELVVEFISGAMFCPLTEGLAPSDIFESIRVAGSPTPAVSAQQRALVQDAVRDLVSLCNADGRTFRYDAAGAEKFLQRWEMKSFREAIAMYGLVKKLPMDRALQVLQEYYVVEPVMES